MTWIASRRIDTLIAASAISAFVATYLVYYPRMYQTEDDASYLAEALALRHGHLTLDSLHQSIVQSFTVGRHLVSKYPPGMPAVLAAASLIGWTRAIAVNLVVVLATCAVVAYLLRRIQVPTTFALLYLLYPTAVLFSRTVMADLLSGLLVAAAIAAVIDERPVVVGLLLGLALLARSGNALACLTIPAGVMFDLWRDGEVDQRRAVAVRWLVKFAVGITPGGVLAAVAYYAVGGGQSLRYTGEFAIRFIPAHLPLLLLGLLLIYPLMLFAPLVFRSAVKTPVVLTCYGFLVLYAAWYYESEGSGGLQTLVVYERYMLVATPLFVVAYAGTLWSMARRLRIDRIDPRWRGVFTGLAAAILVISSVAIQRSDERHTASLANVRAALLRIVSPADLLVCDGEVAKLFLPQWGSRQIYIVQEQSPAEVRQYIDGWTSAVGPAARRVLVADWSAGGLGGPSGENAASVVERVLETAPLADAPRGLPADFQLLLVSNQAGKGLDTHAPSTASAHSGRQPA